MIYTEWGRLKEVIVGKVYDPSMVEFMENGNYKNMLQQVLHETEEDFQKLIKIFKDFNVIVHRPNNVNLKTIQTTQWTSEYPLPAICPRDFHIAYGDTIINTIGGDPNRFFESLYFHDIMLDKMSQGSNFISMPKPLLPSYYENYAMQEQLILYHSANIIKCGDSLLHTRPYDDQEYPERRINQKGRGTYTGLNWLKHNLPNETRWIEVPAAGHVDGKIALLRPGLLMVHDEKIIPNELQHWDRIVVEKHELPNNIRSRIKQEFYNDFVMNNIPHWVGFEDLPGETIFDVNVISIDENTVITNCYNEHVFKECAKRGIECIPFDFRHRFFWDCGIHCITLDLVRDDKKEDYIK
jgi:glycine amidinotransferase